MSNQIILNDDQVELLSRLKRWYDNRTKPIYVYSGGPGTGKTTIIKEFLRYCGIPKEAVLSVAFSGKAVSVLCDNGLDGSTIHSAFFRPEWTTVKDEMGNTVYEKGLPKHKLEFVPKSELDYDYQLIVIDELSMVPDDLMQVILAHGIPVVGIGDINQLPPIFGICSYMLRPDFFLTKIMRQAEGNPIIQFSQDVLHNKRLYYGTYYGEQGNSRILRSIEMDENLINDYDMIICCKNATRDKINDLIRKDIYHRPKNLIVPDDKVICRQNVKSRSEGGRFLTNGTIGWVDYISRNTSTSKKLVIDFVPDYDESLVYSNLPIDNKYIFLPYDERKEVGLTQYSKFEFGNIITCHLSQGSQYNRLLYIDEPFGSRDLVKSLRYTAISRAAKSIDIVMKSCY